MKPTAQAVNKSVKLCEHINNLITEQQSCGEPLCINGNVSIRRRNRSGVRFSLFCATAARGFMTIRVTRSVYAKLMLCGRSKKCIRAAEVRAINNIPL